VTLLSSETQVADTLISGELESDWAAAQEERAGYGNFIVCGCGSYSDDGTGDCRCGHSYGQHYS
jgi:hypothetical protein